MVIQLRDSHCNYASISFLPIFVCNFITSALIPQFHVSSVTETIEKLYFCIFISVSEKEKWIKILTYSVLAIRAILLSLLSLFIFQIFFLTVLKKSRSYSYSPVLRPPALSVALRSWFLFSLLVEFSFFFLSISVQDTLYNHPPHVTNF